MKQQASRLWGNNIMGKNHYAIALLITFFCFFSWTFVVKAEETHDVSLSISVDDNVYYEHQVAGVHYLFLPSDINIDDLAIEFFGEGQTITAVSEGYLDSENAVIRINSGADCLEYAFDIVFEDDSRESVVIEKSNIQCVNISLNEMTLDEINGGSKDISYGGNEVSFIDPTDSEKNLHFGNVEIKGRGNSTWSYAKKPYQIKLDSKQAIFGMGKAKKWILLANYADNTMVKNALTYDLAREMGMPFSTDYRFIDLFIDGRYQGNYLLCEKVEIGSSRLDLISDDAVLVELDDVYGGLEPHNFSNREQTYVLKDSKADDTEQEGSLALQAFSDFEEYIKEVNSVLYAEEKDWEAISNMIDVESFINMYFIEEFSVDLDACLTSFYMYKDGKSDLLHAGPAWDFDKAYNNIECQFDPAKDYMILLRDYFRDYGSDWYAELYKFPEFQRLLKKCYHEAIKGVLESTSEKIDNYVGYLSQSAKMNKIVWPKSYYGGDYDFSTEVSNLKQWTKSRLEYFADRYFYESEEEDITDLSEIYGTPYKKNNGEIVYDVTVPHLVVNQVYGGAKKEAYATHSFIELYNPTDYDVDLSGWSLQYRSSADGSNSDAWTKLNLTGNVPAHCSYLVQCASIKDPIVGSLNIDTYDQSWNCVINNKGLSVVLMCNQNSIPTDIAVYDNEKHLPLVNGYVDMYAVSGNDNLPEQLTPYYETGASPVQSKKKTVRRIAFRDSDDNQIGIDFEEIDYSIANPEYISYIAPRSVISGPWEYDEDKIPMFQISYETYGGDEIGSESYKYTNLPEAPTNPNKEGYSFGGWFMDDEFEVPYNFDKKPAGDITLYAKWILNQYVVSFNAGMGKMSPDETTRIIEYGNMLGNLPIPTRAGYDFIGWFCEDENSVKAEASTLVYADATYIAKWHEISLPKETDSSDSIKLTLIAQGGLIYGLDSFSFSIEAGNTYGTLQNAKRNGYSFKGWYTTPEGGKKIKETDLVLEDRTLYAQWSPINYKISYILNGGKQNKATVKYNSLTSINLPVPTKKGYTFNGWEVTSNEGNVEISDGKISEGSYGNVVLSAQWKPITYYINYYVNNDTIPDIELIQKEYTYDQVINMSEIAAEIERAIALTDRTGSIKSFSTVKGNKGKKYLVGRDYSKLLDAQHGELSLYANWGVQTYFISYKNLDGATLKNPVYVFNGKTDVKLSAPTKPGFLFKGWYIGDSKITRITKGTLQNVELEAKWEEIQYHVLLSANAQNVHGNSPASYSVCYNTDDTLENPYSRVGYTLVGFNTKANGKGISANYDAVTGIIGLSQLTTKNNATVRLYAQWIPNTSVISFRGLLTGDVYRIEPTHTYGKNLKLKGVTRKGYTFLGWTTKTEDANVTYKKGTNYITQINRDNQTNIILEAQFKQNTYSLYIDSNGGRTEQNAKERVALGKLEYSQVISLNEYANRYAKEGYVLKGFCTDKKGKNIIHDLGHISKLSSKNNATVTLYAIWEQE